MNAQGSRWGSGSRLGFLALILAALGWGIYRLGDNIGLDTPQTKIVCFVGVSIVALLLRYGGRIIQLFRQRNSRQPESTATKRGLSQLQISPHRIKVTELKCALRQQYGYFWSRKVSLLMLTGYPADVESLAPGLTSQLWQEGSGTVLVWGGDVNSASESDWLMSLRKLRRQPIDALVWVTSVFDQTGIPGKPSDRASPTVDAMDSVANHLRFRCQQLGWKLPLFVWSLHISADDQSERLTQSVGCLLPVGCESSGLQAQLTELIPLLTAQGTQQACAHSSHLFMLNLADQLARYPQTIVEHLAIFLSPFRPLPLAGVMFSSPSIRGLGSVNHHWRKDNRWEAFLAALPSLPTKLVAKKLGIDWSRIISGTAAALMFFCGVGMAISFLVNREAVSKAVAQNTLAAAEEQPLSTRLQAQLELQRTLARLQYQQVNGTSWYAGFGLNQNDVLLDALWPRYGQNALPLLRDAAAAHLKQKLTKLILLPANSPLREPLIPAAYGQLKLYLMLTHPGKMDAGEFATVLMKEWPQRSGIQNGAWQAEGAMLLQFYAQNLPQHPEWYLKADDGLVAKVRSLLIRQLGLRNSESSLYQKILVDVAHQYADLRLADMVSDTDAALLFSTDGRVPGMFTRQAWEGAVQSAIDKVVSERREEMDWVLSDSKQPVGQLSSAEVLKARLTERYFADFASSWLSFLNGVKWQKAATLSDAIDQLTLMSDARQSPVVALMNTIGHEGKTGLRNKGLSDSLMASAKELFNRDEQQAINQHTEARGPMDATFGPLLALIEHQNSGQSDTNLSLQTFLTRITQVRLRLQQATSAADPQAMTQALAQTVFQGKSVDLTSTRDYGSLVAASLGQEWSGFGQTVFVQPMDQAWQKVLQPAAASLNAQWRAAVVADWNRLFGSRYPFKNVSSEVSLPLLGRYLSAEDGRIARFLQTRLNGVLRKEGSRWMPDSINAQGLSFNPAFLSAINMLSNLADVAFTNGEAGLHFELRPGTASGVMETRMTIDGQTLTYVNQKPGWRRFAWPADTEAPGAHLSWISTQAGTRQYADLPGSWGWVRLLEKASSTPYPGVSSSFSLTWKAHDGRPLNYTLRTEAGDGPLALLKLRNFRLPTQIFRVDGLSVDQPEDVAEEMD